MGIKEDIDLLDSKIARLKTEYEQYFMRLIKREPAKLKEEIEKLILLYSNKSITNATLKFRFNTLVAKHSSYKQYWTRVLRAIEEGTFYREPSLTAAPPASGTGRAPREEVSAVMQPPMETGPGPAHEDGRLKDAYSQYIDAKKQCNEPVGGITYESFVKSVEKSREKAQSRYKTTDVDVKVYVKDGKTRLAITPKTK
ncbi:MAG: hypothetical protein HY887_06785 [Deltaproteobacteria bacterium]|nr:hypothetical protein [Deltaproteobacteria bacterium]